MKTRLIALLACLPFLPAFTVAQDQDKPNVVVMMVDNLGWGELGCCGGGELRGAPTSRFSFAGLEKCLRQLLAMRLFM